MGSVVTYTYSGGKKGKWKGDIVAALNRGIAELNAHKIRNIDVYDSYVFVVPEPYRAEYGGGTPYCIVRETQLITLGAGLLNGHQLDELYPELKLTDYMCECCADAGWQSE